LPTVKLAIIDSGIDTNFTSNSKINFDIANSVRYYSTFEDQNCNSANSYLPVPELELDTNGVTTGNLIDSTTNFYCRTIGTQFDNDSHGTAVAYVAGQVLNSNNQTLDNSIQILPIAMQGYALDTFMLADAIRYATDQGSNVINMSIGSPYKDNVLKSALRYAQQKGVIIVASSGNCGVYTSQNCDTDGDGIQTPSNDEELDNAPNYPASYTDVISVGASNYKDNCPIEIVNSSCPVIDKAMYSNSASNLFAVAPVGNGIIIPQIGQEVGTSFSAPQVAAAIVKMIAIKNLLSSINPNISNSNILDIIKSGATDIIKEDYTPGYYTNKGPDYDTGNGLLNLLGSWKLIKQEFDNLKQTQTSQSSLNILQPSGGIISIINISESSSSSTSSNSLDLTNRIQYRLQGVGGAVDPNLKTSNDSKSEQNQDMISNNIDASSIGKGSVTIRTGGYFP
jgi:Subtilase family